MRVKTKSFKVKKTFGVDVLLKLTKATAQNLEATENCRNYTFNVSADQLSRAVNTTLESHNINLLIK